MDEFRLRQETIRAGEKLEAMSLNRGMSGNISVRCGDGMLISASGAQLGSLGKEDVVFVDGHGHATGKYAPSSEWRLHRDIFAARREVSAVVHTHSVAATTLACLRKEIPPFHYMVVRAGGHNVRCAGYATFGTQELSDRVAAALADRKACLLANHGMIAVGDGLLDAVLLAGEIESLAEMYMRALEIGEPILLTRRELEAAQRQFSGLRYGIRLHGEPPAG